MANMTNKELRKLAERLAEELWGLELDDMRIAFAEVSEGNYGHYRYRGTKKEGYDPVAIEISNKVGFEKPENREQLLAILKHELCHWACQRLGKPHSDGAKFFESELVRIGATSTGADIFADKWKERALAKQKEALAVEVPAFQFEEVNYRGKKYERKYKVTYKGVHIGYIGKWGWGRHNWNPISDHYEYKRLSWTQRNHAAQDLLEKYEAANGKIN